MGGENLRQKARNGDVFTRQFKGWRGRRKKNKTDPAGKQPVLQESFHTGAFTDFK
ncbi:MAG: hypothetical protein MUO63_04660 [Desulfobulbaceae bacterium]|nr:hypothetical protein [Desulfobulbaceae bacterium]